MKRHATVVLINRAPDLGSDMARLLRRARHIVYRANGWREGLRMMYETHPDLVLLEMDAAAREDWETLGRVRLLTDAPVIVISANGELPDARRLKGLRVNAVLTRPVWKEELARAVQDSLASAERVSPVPARIREALRHRRRGRARSTS